VRMTRSKNKFHNFFDSEKDSDFSATEDFMQNQKIYEHDSKPFLKKVPKAEIKELKKQ